VIKPFSVNGQIHMYLLLGSVLPSNPKEGDNIIFLVLYSEDINTENQYSFQTITDGLPSQVCKKWWHKYKKKTTNPFSLLSLKKWKAGLWDHQSVHLHVPHY
jgi:hypothetical protein